MIPRKVLVAFSGGVDSAVAAALLKNDGYEVTGIMMKIYNGDGPAAGIRKKHGCYGPGESEDIEDAHKVAEKLDIPLEIFDLSHEYESDILGYFESEYQAGRTPNPCIRCNQRIKLGSLIDKARSSGLDFDFVATGHYARSKYDNLSGGYQLFRARDLDKDQSYFLSRLSQVQLKLIRFPLGELTKEEVRRLAEKYRLPVADKPESQNFIVGGYGQLLKDKTGVGAILDSTGKQVGTHPGVAFFTIGQRHGLGLAGKEPRYVTSIDPKRNAIFVGDKASLLCSCVLVQDLNWISVERIEVRMNAGVKIRSTGDMILSLIEPVGTEQAKVVFKNAQVRPAPGQTLVFYDGDRVLGSGVIMG